MNTQQITKLLTLLNENKLDELKKELTQHLLNKSDKPKADLVKAVKNFLNYSYKVNGDARPVLCTVQHKKGKQFIISGYSAFLFDNYIKELDELLNTVDENACIEIYNIINNDAQYSVLTENDMLILKNIKKYIAFYKSQEGYDKKLNRQDVYFNNKVFDAKILAQAVEIMANELDTIQITNNEFFRPTQIKGNSILGIILPLRTTDEITSKIINTTNNFLNELKGAN